VCERIVWPVYSKYAPEQAELSMLRSDTPATIWVTAKHRVTRSFCRSLHHAQGISQIDVVVVRRTSYVYEVPSASFPVLGISYEVLRTRTTREQRDWTNWSDRSIPC